MYVFNNLFLIWPSDLMFVTFRNYLLDYLNLCNKREICALRKITEKKIACVTCRFSLTLTTKNKSRVAVTLLLFVQTLHAPKKEKFLKESIPDKCKKKATTTTTKTIV